MSSGYFGALMRSSGLAVGDQESAMVLPRPIDPAAVEVDVERVVSAPGARVVDQASRPQAAAPGPIPDLTRPLRSPAPFVSRADEPAPRTRFASAAQRDPRVTQRAEADEPAAPAVRSETPHSAVGQELVRAAMHWVAADPQLVRRSESAVPAHGPLLPAPRDITILAAAPTLIREVEIDVPPERPRPTPAFPVEPDLAARPQVIAPALPIRPASTPAAPPTPVAPLARDEAIEVSIGAIHVRVDAPAAQTMARPRATAPASGPRASAGIPRRSGLSRRALRRI